MKARWSLWLIASGLGCSGVDPGAEGLAEEAALGSLEQAAISSDVLDCESASAEARLLCELALARINSELDQRGISIDSEGVLFSFEDPTNRKIDTGHSCTVQAEVKHQTAEVRFKSGAQLDVSGNSLSRPLALKVQLPVGLSAEVDVKQTFGTRILGSCNDYASDSYTFRGNLATTANVLVGLSLNPTFGRTQAGDYAIVLRPKVAVGASLDQLDIDFRVSGVSPITPAWTFVTGFGSTMARSTTALFSGDNVKRIVESTAAWDFGMPLLLGASNLPAPIEEGIFELLDKQAEKEAEREVAKFRGVLETQLQAKLAKALELDATGSRRLIIKREYAALVASLGLSADVFVTVPPNPSSSCRTAANALCNSCRGCSACVSEQRRCDELSRAYSAQYQASLTIPSLTPVEPRYTPAPAPVSPGSGQPALPSGAACTWERVTGASYPGGSVVVSRAIGPCQNNTRQEHYTTSGSLVRTDYS